MNTNLNHQLSTLSIVLSLSSSMTNLDSDNNILEFDKMNKLDYIQDNIEDWREKAFNSTANYDLGKDDIDKFDTLVHFTNNLIQKSKDLDSDFVEVVNDNFWDLV